MRCLACLSNMIAIAQCASVSLVPECTTYRGLNEEAVRDGAGHLVVIQEQCLQPEHVLKFAQIT